MKLYYLNFQSLSSMSSVSSVESSAPPKSRSKRYSKVKNDKYSMKTSRYKSRASRSKFDASLPSCSGDFGRSSSKPGTPLNSECESESEMSISCTTPSASDYRLNNSLTTSLPSSLGPVERKTVVLSERQKRWQIVAEENKELLEKGNFSPINALRDSPLLNSFRKRKSDPEFRRSLNRPSKAIKVFSDEEEDQVSNSSNGFPFNKAYDDYFRNLKLFESDEEFSNWIKDTKSKKSKSAYKGGPLADEHLLPVDYTELLDSD